MIIECWLNGSKLICDFNTDAKYTIPVVPYHNTIAIHNLRHFEAACKSDVKNILYISYDKLNVEGIERLENQLRVHRDFIFATSPWRLEMTQITCVAQQHFVWLFY